MTGPVTRLAVLGDPLRFTRSPELHRAGCAALGLACESVAVRTTALELPARLDRLAAEGYRGVNLTHPLKEAALAHLARASDAAIAARSVNTVSLPERAGDTTDGPGFLDLLEELGRDPRDPHSGSVVLLGAGGAARSLAWSLERAGAPPPVVSARDPIRAAAGCQGLAAHWVGWRSDAEAEALRGASVIVNCTPLFDDATPAPMELLARDALVLDLVYAPELTPWVAQARAAGRAAFDGLGLLVHQARHSLALWLERDVPLAPLARAVGWPR